jgi:hypothetical protein
MSAAAAFQHVVHTRRVAVSVSDGLARALRLRGEFPPLIGDLSCEVIEQTVPVPRKFKPALALTSFTNASGFLIVDGTYRRTDRDRLTMPLGTGTYVVRLRGPYYQDREFTLAWPPPEGQTRVPLTPPTNLELLPGPMYPVPDVTATRFQLGPTILRGTVLTAAGAPVERARVEILNLPPFESPPELPPLTLADWPFTTAVTGMQGDWVLVLPGRRYLATIDEIPAANVPLPITRAFTIRITADGTSVDLTRQIPLGTEYSLRATALRGQVVAGAGRPIAGVRISTSVNALTSITRPNGTWFLYFDFDQQTVSNVTVTATTPDGASASDSTVQVEREATVVVPTFHFS